MFQLIGRLSKSYFFTTASADIAIARMSFKSSFVINASIADIVEKLADLKTSKSASECLDALASTLGPAYIIQATCQHAALSTNSRLPAQALSLITRLAENYGVHEPQEIYVKWVADLIRAYFASTAQQIRSAASKAMGPLSVCFGPSLREMLSDAPSAVLSTVDKEIAKYAGKEAPAPTVTFTPKVAPQIAPPAPLPETIGEPEMTGEITEREAPVESRDTESAPVSEIEVTREDITLMLNNQLLAELGNADWKIRKVALDKIRQLLEETGHIQPNVLNILIPRLAARLKDSNRNLVGYTISLLALVASAAGPAVEKHMKAVVPIILANYADNKPAMREIVTKTLDAWLVQVHLEPFLPFLPSAITAEGSVARKEVLAWLLTHKSELGAWQARSADELTAHSTFSGWETAPQTPHSGITR
jgi:cytoskeleton-associated protein 5